MSLSERLARNAVNYDALLEAQALDMDFIVDRIHINRSGRGRGHQPEAKHYDHEVLGWCPSDREDGGDIIGRVTAPSNKSPHTYLKACSSKRHINVLVGRALRGLDVPNDIRFQIDCNGKSEHLWPFLKFYRNHLAIFLEEFYAGADLLRIQRSDYIRRSADGGR